MSTSKKVSQRTINAVAYVIAGDKPDGKAERLSPYRSGPRLIEFFNEFGSEDTYGPDFGSRVPYVKEKLREYESAGRLIPIVEAALDPLHFHADHEVSAEEAVDYLGPYLRREGFEIEIREERCRLRKRGGASVEVALASDPDDEYLQLIEGYLDRCHERLGAADYGGAITLARSMVEAALRRAEAKLDGEPPKYDGKLESLYKRVSQRINIGTDRRDIRENLVGVLRGLASIVHGLAPFRNSAGDAHATTFRAPEHHAKLAVDAALTVVNFVNATFQFQRARGDI